MTGIVSGTEAEVTELTGIDLDGAPPCTCVTNARFLRWCRHWRCGKPSRVRVLLRCFACGVKDSAFLCRVHARFFRDGRLVKCRYCQVVGKCRSNVA